MTPEQWQKTNRIFLAALEREPANRARFVLKEASGDKIVADEVEALLASHDDATTFLSRPALAGNSTQLRPEPLPARSQIGPWLVQQHIGSGGFAQVYQALEQSSRRQIALKISRSLGDEGQRMAPLRHLPAHRP